MRFLCLSDIHGDAAALRRVLAEAEPREFHQLIVCGDLLFPGPEPLETWKLLLERRALCVQGVGDRALAEVDPHMLVAETSDEAAQLQQLVQVRRALGELIVARLRKLEPVVRLPLESGHQVMFVHGSPVDPFEALCPDMSDDELERWIGDETAEIIVCGASHIAFERKLVDHHVVSVGSVGQSPATGFAHATILDASASGVHIEPFDVSL